MDISISEIRSFIHCPYYYRFKYPGNTPLLKVKAKEHWINCLKSVIIDFMRASQHDEKLLELETLQALWQKSWYEDPMCLKYSDGQDQSRMGNSGWLTLHSFYKLITFYEMPIVAIDKPYSIKLKNTKHRLTGTIDVLLTNGGVDYLAIKLVDSTYHATKMFGANDVEMTAYRRALREESDVAIEPTLAYFVLDPSTKDIVITKRTDLQNAVLDETALSVINAIAAEAYYPDFGNKCHNCDYLSICDKAQWVMGTKLFKY